MTKEYIRKCDFCKKEIKDLYDYGVTTIYKQVRVGRGQQFKDYTDNNIRNKMVVIEPNDYDGYSKGFEDDEDREFSFCSPECLFSFFDSIYEDTYNSTVNLLKNKKKELLEEISKTYKSARSWFSQIKMKFNSKMYVESAIEELNELKEDVDAEIKRQGVVK